ncbi:MAG TPA: hypothetical protein VMR20_04195, partial [Verrucomicrobiae bacterium]|nr:hypothetical protein [Verrucomicrobiae bacterium]
MDSETIFSSFCDFVPQAGNLSAIAFTPSNNQSGKSTAKPSQNKEDNMSANGTAPVGVSKNIKQIGRTDL